MKIKRLSLGVEELSMAYGLIGKPEMGQMVLASAYEELTEAQVDTLLTSASHSLLARGICSINEDGSVHLDEDVERALYPVVLYDYLLTFSMEVRGKETIQSQLFVSQKLGFTSHFVRSGVVHVIEQGPLDDLSDYIADTFGSFIPASFKYDGEHYTLDIELSSLGKAINAVRESKSPEEIFLSLGWNKEVSNKISKDISDQILRGSVLRVNVGSQASEEEVKKAKNPTVLFLLGMSKVWSFEFQSAGEDEKGIAISMSWNDFVGKLQDFAS